MGSNSKFRDRGLVVGLLSGAITTFLGSFAYRLITEPVVLYGINHEGGNVQIVMKNHGIEGADRIRLELELKNAVRLQPLITDDYANIGQSASKYLSLKEANRIIQFDDLGKLGGFDRGEKFGILTRTIDGDSSSNYKKHDLSVIRHADAWLIRIDGVDTDFLLRAVFFAFIIGIIFVLVMLLYAREYLRVR